jgi:hypothetical protein
VKQFLLSLDIPSVLPVNWPSALVEGIITGQMHADTIEVNSHTAAPVQNLFLRHTYTLEQRELEEDGVWCRGSSPPAPRGIPTGSVPQCAGIHGLSLS